MNEIEAAKEEALRRHEKILRTGQDANKIYQDPSVVQALGDMRQVLVDNLISSSWSSYKERQEIYRMLKTLGAFEKEFERRISEGEKAQSAISRLVNKVRQLA